MTSAPTKYAHYLADFQSLTQGPGSGAPAWLKDIRNNAWSRFAATGFPTARRGNERWKYTNVGPLAKIDFDLPLSPAAANGSKSLALSYPVEGPAVYDLVYIDGRYSSELSSPAYGSGGVTAASLATTTIDNSFDLESQVGMSWTTDDTAPSCPVNVASGLPDTASP